jgi:hypothetical protein
MHIVEVRNIGDDGFCRLLKEMRLWLDEHRYEPSAYIYLELNPGTSIQVSFKVPEEAEAFARQFRGSLRASSV